MHQSPADVAPADGDQALELEDVQALADCLLAHAELVDQALLGGQFAAVLHAAAEDLLTEPAGHGLPDAGSGEPVRPTRRAGRGVFDGASSEVRRSTSSLSCWSSGDFIVSLTRIVPVIADENRASDGILHRSRARQPG